MTSVIHYRFKNTTEPFSTLTFEGQSLPLSSLKQLIAQHKHLHRQSAHDFDLVVADAQTGDEYVRDDERIHKNAQVVVRRVPNTKAKTITTHLAPEAEQSVYSTQTAASDCRAARAQSYELFTDTTFLFLSLCDLCRPTAASPTASLPAALLTPALDAQPTAFTAPPQQQQSASARQHRRPPPGYLCKRCGSPDHFVQHCPLYPNPPAPSSSTTAAAARPSQPSTAPARPAVSGPPADLLCSLCHNLYHNPVVVPCCFTSFCDECIRQALLWEDGFQCPSCQHRPVRLDELRPNDGLRMRVEEWMASRGEKEKQDGDGNGQLTAAGEDGSGGTAGAGAGAGAGGDGVSVEDDVSVILAEPSAGQLRHQAKRDKQQNANNTLRCFTCGEPGHRAAQCPNRQQPQQQQHPQQPMPPPMQDQYMANGYGGGGPMYNNNDMAIMQPYGMPPYMGRRRRRLQRHDGYGASRAYLQRLGQLHGHATTTRHADASAATTALLPPPAATSAAVHATSSRSRHDG